MYAIRSYYDHLRRRVGDVQDQAQFVGSPDYRAPEIGQPVTADPVQRAAEFVVEEVCQPGNAQALPEQRVDVRKVAFERRNNFV